MGMGGLHTHKSLLIAVRSNTRVPVTPDECVELAPPSSGHSTCSDLGLRPPARRYITLLRRSAPPYGSRALPNKPVAERDLCRGVRRGVQARAYDRPAEERTD